MAVVPVGRGGVVAAAPSEVAMGPGVGDGAAVGAAQAERRMIVSRIANNGCRLRVSRLMIVFFGDLADIGLSQIGRIFQDLGIDHLDRVVGCVNMV